MIIVRVEHIRAAKVCTSGARAWFTERGLSWTEFLENGMEIDTLRAMNDPLGNRVADVAEKSVL